MVQQHETCHKENALPVPCLAYYKLEHCNKKTISEKKLKILCNSEVVLASYMFMSVNSLMSCYTVHTTYTSLSLYLKF